MREFKPEACILSFEASHEEAGNSGLGGKAEGARALLLQRVLSEGSSD
jgi:hypothetical protein